MSKIVFQDWIVDLGRDPQATPNWLDSGLFNWPLQGRESHEVDPVEIIGMSVRRGIEALSTAEPELVIRVHYMGESMTDISRRTGRSISKISGMHQRVLRKLRKSLSEFVFQRYGIKTASDPSCPICSSPFRREIDSLIANRDTSRSWKPVISELHSRWSIRIISPQLLIGHHKYHR